MLLFNLNFTQYSVTDRLKEETEIYTTDLHTEADEIKTFHIGRQEALLSQRSRAMLRVCIASIL